VLPRENFLEEKSIGARQRKLKSLLRKVQGRPTVFRNVRKKGSSPANGAGGIHDRSDKRESTSSGAVSKAKKRKKESREGEDQRPDPDNGRVVSEMVAGGTLSEHDKETRPAGKDEEGSL